MQTVTNRFIRLFFAIAAIVGSTSALADYAFVSIDYPGATDTQVFGVNNAGQAVGSGFDADANSLATFTYDSKKGGFTPIAGVTGSRQTDVLGINEPGVMVGGGVFDVASFESGFVRSKNGAYTVFSHPDCLHTEARAINNTGLVSGYSRECPGYVGFTYDPARDLLTDFLPSTFTLAHGINSQGQVVGSVQLIAGVACPTCVAGRYGFLRAASGALTYFRVNGRDTNARAITDSGLIAGWVRDAGIFKGFVTTLAGLPNEAITIPSTELLAYPGALQTLPLGITDAGAIVGDWQDTFGKNHGFIATPLPPKH